MSDMFAELKAALQSGGVPAALDRLISRFQADKRHHELFEARKMQARMRAGLPLVQTGPDETLAPAVRDGLEEGLFAACREVGELLLAEERIREGWMYLRPVVERREAAQLLSKIEATEENLDDLVEVLLQEGVDVPRGFSLVLEHYGTCNAITTFDSVVAQQSREDQRRAAGLLVEHLHAELLATVRADIAQQQGAEPEETTLATLVADRDWLFGEHSYHVDTTHLSSVVRSARLLDDPRLLGLAVDLTAYGQQLHTQFQYPGDEPFAEMYPSHSLFFRALRGEAVDEAVEYFRSRAASIDPSEKGTMPAETYIDLLARVGRPRDAIAARLEMLPADIPALGIAPSLFELSRLAGDYETMIQHCEQREDLLGYATGLLCSQAG